MGYESKLFVVRRTAFDRTEHTEPWVYGEIVAEYDLCKMGNVPDFYNAFRKEIDYTLWLPGRDKDGNEAMVERDYDAYGEHMKSADIGEVIAALERVEVNNHYRRLPPLIAMLKAFAAEQDEWGGELEVVHYGY